MSLNVSLNRKADEQIVCSECGQHYFPNYSVYDANITHNLGEMADAAGIYGIVWRPEENGITTAEQLIEPLEKAIADMKARPEYYEQFNSPNGWGTYKDFVPWLEKYLAACKEYPDAVVEVSR